VERNLQRLRLKRIDGVFTPTFSNGEYILKKLKLKDQFKIEKIPNSSLDLYFVFRKNIDEKTFNTLNSLFVKKRSAYNSLLEKYLSPQ
jgi:polar amino acid transport system substrate-binding protein